MTDIQVLLFDVGGVLGTNGWDRHARRAACEQFDLDWEDLADRHVLVADAFETGELTLDQYLERTVFYRNRDFTRDEFAGFMFAQSEPWPESLAVLGALAESNSYTLATLNNESRELNEHRIDSFGLRRYFSMFLSSCYLGMRKPDEQIYRLALDIVQRRPEQCLFIDDRQLNLECAALLGIPGIRFEGADALRSSLADFGINA